MTKRHNKQNTRSKKPYIIMEDTMAILPCFTSTGHLNSTVLEEYQEIHVETDPFALVDGSCDYYGSDLAGRLKSAQTILKGKRMLPALISERNKVCMVPSCSPYSPECIWLSYKHILEVVKIGNQSIVLFTNYQKLELDITRGTLDTKLDMAARLISTHDIRQSRISDLYKKQAVAETPCFYNFRNEEFHNQFDQ